MISRKELLLMKSQGKLHLEKYLHELNALCRYTVTEADLMGLEDTYAIIEKTKAKIPTVYNHKRELKFSEKKELAQYFDKLNQAYSQGVYLFIKYSKYCGALSMKSLSDFNVNFRFEDEHAGLISMFDQDITGKILLDYYEDNSEQLIELEIYGERWKEL